MAAPPPPPPPLVTPNALQGGVKSSDLSGVMKGLRPTVTVVRHFTNVLEQKEGDEDDGDEDMCCPTTSNQELLWRAEWISTRDTYQCSSSESSGSLLRVAVLLIDGKRQQHPKFERFAYILCGQASAHRQGFFVRQFDCDDLAEGKLTTKEYDVLVVPGGSIFEVEELVDKAGANHILSFVESGGGYFGVCAGGFLATRNGYMNCKPKYGLLNAQTGWVPGVGTAHLSFSSSPLARAVFGKNISGKDIPLHFANGSTMGAGFENPEHEEGSIKPGDMIPLATYTLVKTNQKIVKFDKTSQYPHGGGCGEYGKGRVVAFGPHPEASGANGSMIVKNSILWCGRRR